MSLNWLEDLVSHYYKLDDYIVSEDISIRMPKREGRKVRGNSDIDILAIKNKEILHIQCQTWWGPGSKNEKESMERLNELYQYAPDYIRNKYPFLKDYKIKNIFITGNKPKNSKDGPWSRLEKFCEENDIELIDINTIIWRFIESLREKVGMKGNMGKEEGVTRFLIHLIRNDFIRTENK